MRTIGSTILLLFAFSTIASAQAVLRVGDPVELRIGGVPTDEQNQVNNTYSVDESGSISLPYISKVRAAGLAPAQVSAEIEGRYRAEKIYTNPTITIVIPASARFVNVGGAVRSPSRIPFTEDMTLLTAINAAGGFNDFADQKRVRVLRGDDATRYDVRQFRRDPSRDVRLQPGDRVEVPQRWW